MAGTNITLCRMPQLAEAVELEDDWTGVTDAVVRRRRQNRLNSRAFRRRKALESARPVGSQSQIAQSPAKPVCLPVPRARVSASRQEDVAQDDTQGENLVPCWIEAHQSITSLAVTRLPHRFRGQRKALLPYSSTTPASLDQVILPLSSDHLITLLQYNVLRGCLENRRLLTEAFFQDNFNSPAQLAESGFARKGESDSAGHGGGDEGEWSSTALAVLPALDDTARLSRLLPRSLHPTFLQSTVPHPAWIDILPHPVLRDNLILATAATATSDSRADGTTNPSGDFDPDALWTDTVGDLFSETGPSSSSQASTSLALAADTVSTSSPSSERVEDLAEAVFAGGIVWSPPWDVSGWELSEGFWRKWGWMMKGCAGEILEATNRWRRQRGEEELLLDCISVW